jgi:hypothetical protein
MSKWLNSLFKAGVLSWALSLTADCMGADRILRAQDMTVARGETNTLLISLESLGDENALGFTLCFDTNHLQLVPPVRRGSAISNLFPSASFTANTNRAFTNGLISVIVGLDIGMAEVWPAGTNQLVEVRFRGVPGAGSTNTTVALCDAVTPREVSDITPDTLPTTYVSATVLVQGACNYLLGTNQTSVPSPGGSNVVSVSTDFSCSWTVENTNSWIVITGGNGGTGSGLVQFSVDANLSFLPRVGTVTIAGQAFTVNQAPFVCSYVVVPTNSQHGHVATTNAWNITASNSCNWTVENSTPWITIQSPSSGIGSAVVEYSISGNPTILVRTGLVTVAGQQIAVVQDGLPCTYALAPVSRSHGFGSETNTFDVMAPAGCVWTVSTTNSWLEPLAGLDGSGAGTVTYRVSSNPDNTAREGAILVNGQAFLVSQAAAPCNAVLAPITRNHGFGSENGLVTVTIPNGCVWTTANTNTWVTIDSGAAGNGGGSVGYTVSSNSGHTARSGYLVIAGAEFLVSQAGSPCPTVLVPTNGSHGFSVETGSVTVTLSGPCDWSTVNTNDWITVLVGTGAGSGTATYAVGLNTNIASRTGTLLIGGQSYGVTQGGAPCTYALAPVSSAVGYQAATNTIVVTANPGCAWVVENTNAWIGILSGTAGNGNDMVSYAVAANPTGLSRSGNLIVGDQLFAVNQDAAPCTYSISPTTRTHGFTAATNTVVLNTLAGCAWTISNVTAWIVFPNGTNGAGSATNIYHVEANPDPFSRTGVVMVADKLLTIVQNPAPCLYVLAPGSAVHGSGSETGLVSITTHAACAWTADTTDGWITITTTASGTGPGGIGYSLAANTNAVVRIGHLTIGGQSFTITQSGLPCSYAVAPTNVSRTFNAETTTVSVTALEGCTWTVSNGASWIQILSGTNGSGTSDVTFLVESNASTLPRSTVMVVAGAEVTVEQAGAPCSYVLTPAHVVHAAAGATSSVAVAAGVNCDWTASTTNEWLVLTATTNGAGAATIDYTVAANPDPIERVGALFIGGAMHVITQQALVCNIVLFPGSRSHGYESVTNTFAVTANGAGCPWTATTTNSWITLSVTNGTGSGVISYTVAQNPSGLGRSGKVRVGTQEFTISQYGAPCVYALAPGQRTHGYESETNTLSLTATPGCSWSINNTNGWIVVLSAASGSGSGVITYAVVANPVITPRTGNVVVAGQMVEISQNGAPCTYALTPVARTHGHAGGSDSFALDTLVGCAWDVLNTNLWIQITSAGNGTGDAVIAYTVSSNVSVFPRAGTVQVGGQSFTINQDGAPCLFAVLPVAQQHGYQGATNSFSVTTQDGCVWNAENTNTWIALASSSNQTNGGTAGYVVAPNASHLARTGTVVVAGQAVTIAQAGAPCSYVIAPEQRAHGYEAVTNSVDVTPAYDCPWTVASSTPWISILSPLSGTGTGTVSYALAANPEIHARTGTVQIADQVLTLEQAGAPCTYELSPGLVSHPSNGATGTVALVTLTDCPWTVVNTNTWIEILSPTNGTSSTAIDYAVTANLMNTPRTGVVVIANQVLTISQAGVPCEFVLSPTNGSHGALAEEGAVSVTAALDCPWAAVSLDNWITILPPTSYVGTGEVRYAVAANPAGIARQGSISIEGTIFPVTQAAAPCTFAVTPSSASFAAGAVTGSVNVVTLPGCVWHVETTNEWITIPGGATNTGSGGVSYTLSENVLLSERVGYLAVAGSVVVVTQAATVCTYALAPSGATHGSGGETGLVTVSTGPNCPWDVINTNSWILLTGTTNAVGAGTVSYSVQANPTALTRTGVLQVAGESFVVTQDGAPCSYSLVVSGASHGAQTTTGAVAVTTLVGCVWNVATATPWVTILSPLSQTNSGSVDYSVDANPTGLTRIGSLIVAGQTFTVTQAGAACTFALETNQAALGFAAVSNSVAITTLVGCPWSVVNTNPWIALVSPVLNTNSGVVVLSVTANPTSFDRTGAVSIAGLEYTVQQAGAPCSFSLSPESGSYGYAAATGTVSVTTLLGCEWTASSGTPWISLLSPASNTNSGMVTFAVAENTTALSRTGLVTIAGQSVTVIQTGAGCTYSLATALASHGFGPETNTVGLTTLVGCAWSVSTATPWLSILSPLNQDGSGSVTYAVAANPTALVRTGTVNVAGQTLVVTQLGAPCTFALATNRADVGYAASSNSVMVTTLVGCAWSVVNTNTWIALVSPTENSDSGVVTLGILANPAAFDRTGVVSIAGIDYTVKQAGAPCSFSLDSYGASFGSGAETTSVIVTTIIGCPWTVSNTNAWITPLTPVSNTNSDTFTFAVAENPAALPRSGTFFIAGEAFTVVQGAAGCVFSLGSPLAQHGSDVETNSVELTTLVGCEWSVASGAPWIEVLSPLNVTNSGTVTYRVLANPAGLPRTGTVSVAGLTFTVAQAAAPCTFSLGATTAGFTYLAATGTVSVTTLTGCTWTATSLAPWISVLTAGTMTGSGTATYAVEANPTALARTGLVSIAGQTLEVSQAGAPCTFSLSSNLANVAFFAATNDVALTTLIGCSWTVTTATPWISILSPVSQTNSGTVRYAITENPTALPRTGTLSIASQTFTVVQGGAGCVFALSSNSATFAFAATTGAVSVTTLTGCVWTVSTATPWISVVPPVSRTNNGVASFSLLANPTALVRTGTVVVAGQPFAVTQSGAPCNYVLASNSASHAFGAVTGAVSVTTLTGCVWTVSTVTPWISIPTATVSNSGSATYVLQANPTALPRTGSVSIAGQTFAVTQAGAPCTYTLGVASATHGSNPETNSVTVTTLVGCSWTVSGGAGWVTILGPASQTNSGSFSYSVASNPTALARTTTVTVAGQLLTVIQTGAACNFSLASSNAAHGPAVETNSVAVTTLVGCPWSVVNTNGWISILSSTNQTGSGTVNYSVATNASVLSRTGVVEIAGLGFTVTQTPGAACTLVLQSSNWMHRAGPESGIIGVISPVGCAWPVINTNSWVTVLTGPSIDGAGHVLYSVATNPAPGSRSGAITVGGIAFALTQAGNDCTYRVSPTNRVHGSGTNGNTIVVTAGASCSWTAINTNDWITILSNGSGTGNQTISYIIARNFGAAPRSGYINVGGDTLFITQWGTACGFSANPPVRNHGPGAASSSAPFNASVGSCAWTVVNTNPWVTITSATSGTGAGSVSYNVTANPNGTPRTGVFTVGGASVVVNQSGVSCSFSVSPLSAVHAGGVETGEVSVVTGAGCIWYVFNTNSWITLNGWNGTNSGTIGYSLAANPSITPRAGIVIIGGQEILVTQAGAPCTYALAPALTSPGSAATVGSFAVQTLAGCSWSASSDAAWIILTSGGSGVGSGTVNYAVTANTSVLGRTGTVTVASQVFTVRQAGAPCGFSLSSSSASHGGDGESGSVTLTTDPLCSWSVVNTNGWITIASGGTGSASLSYTVAANPAFAARSGVVVIAGQTFTVTQAAKPCTYVFSPSEAVFTAAPVSASFSVAASNECSWIVVNTNSWITITSSTNGSGSTSVSYSLVANPGGLRMGNVYVGGTPFRITQAGTVRVVRMTGMDVARGQTNRVRVILEALGNENAVGLSVSFDTNQLAFVQAVRGVDATNLNATFNVNASAGSLAQGRVGFALGLDIGSGTTFPPGSNVVAELLFRGTPGTAFATTTVGFTNSPVFPEISDVDANTLTASFVPAQVNVIGTCTYGLSSNATVVPVAGGSGGVSVTANPLCAWAVINTNSWIQITSATNGQGNGTVSFSASANPAGQSRAGVILVGGVAFTVSQAGVPCSYSILPSDRSHGAGVEGGVISVTSAAGCAWAVVNTNSWVMITSALNGVGNGDVTYAIDANASSLARSGIFTVAGQSFTVSQAGSACVYVVIPTNRVHGFLVETGTVSVFAPFGCVWSASNTNSWITMLAGTNGSGDGVMTFSVAYNADGFGRTGAVTVAGQVVTIVQSANTCPVVLSAAGTNHGPLAVSASFSIAAASCPWTVSNTNGWIAITSATNGSGNATVNYSITANPTLLPRSGVIRVSGREYVVSQDGATCLYSLAPTDQAHGFEAGSGVVALTTFTNCDWTVINTNPWVTVTSATNGVASTVVTYDVAANATSVARSGWMVIGGQPFAVSQAGAPCTYVLSQTSPAHGFAQQTNILTVTTVSGCRWTVSNTNAWISILTSTNQTNSGTLTYSVSSNATSLTRVGNVLVGDQVLTVTQTGVPCVYAITPTNRAHSFAAATNSVVVSAPVGCVWDVVNSNSWITISNLSGSGPGIVYYSVAANPAAFARTGLVTVAGQTLVLTQPGAPCTYTLSVTNLATGPDTDVFDLVVNSLVGCSWTVVNTNSWIEFLEQSGSGPTTITYAVYENVTGASRTGRVTVAGQTLTVVQSGQPCFFTLSATNAVYGPGAETNAISVSTLTGCPWTVSNTNPWISILNGTNFAGAGTVNYSVQANPLALSRIGTFLVAGQLVTIAQNGLTCTYTLSSSNITLSSGNVTGLVSVASAGNCTWVVVNTNAWIAIKSGGAGTNNGLVRFTAANNSFPSARSGNLVVAGIPFTVTQLGSPCSYSLSATGRLHGSLSETGQVSVFTVSECGWDVNNTNDWITFTSATNGAGTALISYSLTGNPGFTDRVGVFNIADQTYTITQLGAACSYVALTNSAYHGALVETGTVVIASPAGCAFTVAKSNSWITILSSSAASNFITVNYSVAVNVSGAQRIGQITVGNASDRALFTVTQATVFCTFAVGPTNFSHGFESEGGAISVTTSNPCPWTVVETNTWITISGGTSYTGNATVNYTVSANPSGLARTGIVMVAGQQVRIVQAGLICSYAIAPGGRPHGFLAATGTVVVTSPTLCSWNVNRTNTWITIQTPTNVVGPSTVTYAIAQNPSATPRSSVVMIAGQPFTISQEGAPFILASNKTANCNTAWDFDAPVNAGNCLTPGESVFVLSTTTNFGCGPTYVATRVWDATDACGSRVLATQIVSVVTPPPLISCAPNKTVECTSAWMFDSPTAVEFCGGTNVSIRVVSTITVTNGMCGSTYVVTRTWEATDSCSNKTSCSQSVFVVDTTPPVAFCPTNKTVECGSPWVFDPPTGLDGCSGTNVTVRVLNTVTNLTGTCGYVATRTWEVVDPCTNKTTCVQVVTAVDTLPPVLSCGANKIVECGVPWNFDAPSANDYCLGTNVTLTVSSTVTNKVGFCGNTYMATRTWQAADGCGNLSFCSQTVRVVDTTPPTVVCATNRTVEFGQPWSFQPPTGTDGCGGTNVTISIVSTVTNAGPCGPGYTATRVWEIVDACSNKVSCTQVITVPDTTPPVVVCVPDKNINCLGVWSFDPPSATDIGSGTNVTFTIISTVTNGTCGSGFTATRTWRATDACGNSSTCSQTAYGRAIVAVSGTVFCPTNYPATVSDKRVPGVTLVGPTNTTAMSVADGTYNLLFDAAAAVSVQPQPPATADPAEGVTTLDISVVRRHILNVAGLDSPYKLLAGDVDNSGAITTLDLSQMRRLVLGLTNRLPAGLWRFVPSDYAFTNPAAPWYAPTNRTYPAVNGDVAGQDFVAVKLGDVNGSLNLTGGTPKRSQAKSGSSVVFNAGSATNVPGTSVVVRVTVSGFNQVGTAQGTITWDPSVARFARVEQFGLNGLAGGNFGTNRTPEGKMSFSWDDPNAQGVSVLDGTAIFAVRFELTGSPGSQTPLAFSSDIAACEATVNLVPVPFQPVAGQIVVEGTAPAPNALRLLPGAFADGAFGFSTPTVIGKTYVLEYTDSLSSTNWIALPAHAGDGNVQLLSDPAPSAQQRFYRLRIQ